MAKAKKSASDSAPKASGASKKSAKAKASAAPATSPLVDTSLAAENAAKMLRAGLNKSAPVTGPKSESAMFKQLKAGLNKPAGNVMDNLLDTSHGPANPKQSHSFNKQVGHAQTFNADITRSGVPRRNPG